MTFTFRATDIHTDNIHLEPDLSVFPSWRGTDSIAPGHGGRFIRPRLLDRLVVPVNGYVKGTGTTRAERAESWRASTDILIALLDPTLAPGLLVVGPPLMGVTEERSILVRPINAIHGRPVGAHYETWSIEMECVDDPPEWVIGSSS